MRVSLSSWILLLTFSLLPVPLRAQVLPPGGGGGGGTPTFPVTTCTNSVGVGMTVQGVLTCETVTPAMTTGLVPSGGDVSATGQVTASHFALPVPVPQGGLGITAGNAGGLLYFLTPTSLNSSGAFPLNAPLFGGGAGNPPLAGDRSGTTLEVATVLGPHVANKQLAFDVNGNIYATATDIGAGGGGGGGSVLSVFGRTGTIVAQSGDYTAEQVLNAANLQSANVFANPSGQAMPRLVLLGAISGNLSIRPPSFAGTSMLTLPAGNLDMTTTGGPGQVLQQSSGGGPLTVGQLAFSELTGTTGVCTTVAVCTGYQAALGFTPENVTNKATTTALGLSDQFYPTQNAVKVYVDTGLGTKQPLLGFTPEDTARKNPSTALGSSTTDYPTQNAVKVYVDTGLGTKQPLLGFVAEDVARKNSSTALGSSTVDYPTQNAVKVYVDTGLAAKQATLGFTPENVVNKATSTSLGASDTAYPTQNAVKVYVDTGLATKQATLGFTPEDVARKNPSTALGTSGTDYPTQNAVKVYVDAGLATKQATLGFTPENAGNKAPSTLLGTSDTAYPSQNAVKVYVDTGLAMRQGVVTWGAGLSATGDTARTDSLEAGFLANGGVTNLTCGVGQAGKMQVLASGELQYCDGATTTVLRSGTLTQSGLVWNITTSGCTADANGGKLTLNPAGTQIVCASDIGGPGGTGGVASVFGRTGAVAAQSGDYSVTQITNAADLTAANVFSHATGQTMAALRLPGSSTGVLTIRAAAISGASVLTFPAGVTDLSATGGTGQVLRQSSLGAALTVGTLAFTELTGIASVCTTATVCAGYQAALGFTPENSANKSTVTTLGASDTAYPSQNAVKVYVDAGLATKQGTLGFTPENIANKSTSTGLGASDVSYPSQNAVKVYVDTGLATKQATLGFTPENVVNKSTVTTLGTSDVAYPTQNAVKIYVDTGLSGKQATLGFTPENSANKATSTSLGTSDVAYPSQNAVKVYVDTADATKQATVTWGAGLAATGATARTASTEADFLTDGGVTNLVCGAGQQGKMQVMDTGELQYCGGEATPLIHAGVPTQLGFTWNVTSTACTSDPNGGKLTLAPGGTQIICASDQGGGGGTGITGATQFGAMYAQSTTTATSTLAMADGQLLIGRTGAAPLLGSLGGTPLQIEVLPGPGTLTLRFPPGGVTLPGTTTGGTFTGTFSGNATTASGLSSTLACAQTPQLIGTDVNMNAGSCTPVIANNAVTLAKMADIATARILGRTAAGTGDPEALDVTQVKAFLALTFADFPASVASDAQIPDLSALSTGLTVARCVETDPTTGRLVVAAGRCTVLAGATANGAMYATGTTTASSTAALTNGQVMLGSTGTAPVAGSIQGTTDQIRVTPGPGTLVLDFPPTGVTTRVNPRTFVHGDLPTITADCNAYDEVQAPTLTSATVTLAVPTCTPVNGQTLVYRLASSVPRLLAFDQGPSGFSDTSGVPFPPTTIGTTLVQKWLVITTRWNAAILRWALVYVSWPVPKAQPLLDAATITSAGMTSPPGINCDTTELGRLATVSQSSTFAKPICTPRDGQSLQFAVCSGTPRALSWDTSAGGYRAGYNVPLPTLTTGSGACDLFGFKYHGTDARWDFVATTQPSGAGMTISEVSGADLGTYTKLLFTNNSVTNNGDGTATVTTGVGGGGDVSSNTATSIDGEVPLFSLTTGKVLKRSTTLTYNTGTLAVGAVGTGGRVDIAGSGSGVVSIQPQVAAGTYNFNLPITAGLDGQVLTSGGGVSVPMRWVTPTPGTDAIADGSTKGLATFVANDFNSAAGVISLDYLNGQKATSTVSGFLSFTDWTSFNAKVNRTGTPVDNQIAVWTDGTTVEGVPALTYNAGTLGIGVAGTVGGKLAIAGSASGVITMQPQATAGTYNWNYPTTAGLAGQVLRSQGGGAASPMDWLTLANSATTDTTDASNISTGILPAARIGASTITYAKLQNTSAVSVLLGRGAAGGLGPPQEISLSGLTMVGTTLTVTATGGHVIQDEGVSRLARTNLNFIGGGVSCADNAGANATDCTIGAGGDITSVGDCSSGACDAVGNFIVKPMVTALSGTTITMNLATTRYAEIAALTGPTSFANPTGTSYNKEKITYHVCAAAAQPLTWSGSEFRFPNGVPAPVTSTGGGTCDLFAFERDLAAVKWDFIATTQNSASSRRSQCSIAIGLDNDVALSDSLMQRWKVCRIPTTATIEQISIEAMPETTGITPSVAVHRRTGGVNTALLATPLTAAANGGLACARVTAEPGLEGTGCSATLVSGQVALPGGDVVLGTTSGTASGATAVTVTIYYLKTS